MSMRLLGAGIAAALLLTAPPGHRSEAKPHDLPLDPTGKCEIEETQQRHGSLTVGVDLTGQLHVHLKTNDLSLDLCPCTSVWSMMTQLGGLWYQALQKDTEAGETPADDESQGTLPPAPSESGSQPDTSATDAKQRHHPWRGHWHAGDHSHHFFGHFFHGIDHMQADRDLRIADFYRRTGHLNTAKFYYGLVCRRHHGTAQAEIARQRAHEIRDCQEFWEALVRDFFGPRVESTESCEKKEVVEPASNKEGNEACDPFWLEQAKNMYLIGEWLRRDGEVGMAENCYYKARMLCPGSTWAQQARERIAEMEQESSVPPPPVNDTDDPIPPSSEDVLPPSDDTSFDQNEKKKEGDDACDPKQVAQARRLYMVGENCHRQGDMAMAENCFRETCLVCPTCSWAELARQRLAEMEREAVRQGGQASPRVQWGASVFVTPNMQWAVPNSVLNGPPVPPPFPAYPYQYGQSPTSSEQEPANKESVCPKCEEMHRAVVQRRQRQKAETCQPAIVPTYRVPEGGKHMLIIAEETLGNRCRWGEIFRLNTGHNPLNPCPAGMLLKLPADAKIPESAQPESKPQAEPQPAPSAEIDFLKELERTAEESRRTSRDPSGSCPYLQMPASFQAEQARKLYHRGLRWEEAGDVERARHCFQAAHKACPDCSFGERAMQHLINIEKRDADSGIGEEQEVPPTPKESKDEARARRLLQGTVPLEIYLDSELID
jgi:DNA-directed RNA polymerase subunit M/transcription elongation factor TFIIS